MAIASVDVDNICSEQELNDFLGGLAQHKVGLQNAQGSTKYARQFALNRVLEMLQRRSPPIIYSDLQAPAELKHAVLYGAAEHLYQVAMTSGDDLHDKQRELWEQKFDKEVRGLVLTLSGDAQVHAGALEVERG